MTKLKDKKILLGVTGSISVYKACELARSLIKAGATVRVVMTENATRFVSPMLFETLTGWKAYWRMFGDVEDNLAHINLSAWADIFLIAPASANFIAKAACGLADDLLTSTLIAFDKKVLVAPAMNNRMWANPITQSNALRLKELGFEFVGPGRGALACGDIGEGRFAEIEDIVFAVERAVAPASALAGKRVLISAGPTREFLDDVRFLSNPSTGKMGFALAREAALRGARVTLVSGALDSPQIPSVQTLEVTTAAQMAERVFETAREADVIIMSAAVSDFTADKIKGKFKKGDNRTWRIELKRTTDILAELGATGLSAVLAGFAVETEREVENAREKLVRKNLDLIFVNNPNVPGTTFSAETNAGYLIDRESTERVEMMSKDALSGLILDKIEAILAAR